MLRQRLKNIIVDYVVRCSISVGLVFGLGSQDKPCGALEPAISFDYCQFPNEMMIACGGDLWQRIHGLIYERENENIGMRHSNVCLFLSELISQSEKGEKKVAMRTGCNEQ